MTEVTDINSLMAIYPNPNYGHFTVTLPEHKGDAVVIVTDLSGRTILQRTFASEERTADLGLENAASGTYFVKAMADGKIFNEKIVVNK
jgi:hypothetical protein